MAISSNQRQWQYYQIHQITAEGNLDFDPCNNISAAQNTIVQVFVDDNDKGQIAKRFITNYGTAIVYISISEFTATGVNVFPLNGGISTGAKPAVPDGSNFHLLIPVNGVLDLSWTDAAVYANCTSAALLLSTVQAKRA